MAHAKVFCAVGFFLTYSEAKRHVACGLRNALSLLTQAQRLTHAADCFPLFRTCRLESWRAAACKTGPQARRPARAREHLYYDLSSATAWKQPMWQLLDATATHFSRVCGDDENRSSPWGDRQDNSRSAEQDPPPRKGRSISLSLGSGQFAAN